jgi:hypothetical protein
VKRISVIYSIVVFALIAGTGGREAAASDVYDGSFNCESGPLSLTLPSKYPELVALGKNGHVADGSVQDYGTYKATQRAIQFEGLRIVAYVFSNDPDRYLLTSVVISDSRWKLGPLWVGQLAQSALKHQGWPAPPVDGSWELSGDSQSVSVTIQGGSISRVTYNCDSD